MAPERRWVALLLATLVVACAGDSTEKEEAEAAARFAAARARTDSIRAARQGADSAATTPQQRELALADSLRRAQAPAPEAAPQAATLGAAPPVAEQATPARAESDVQRETFAYGGGARDPFVSVINAKNAGPELVDLQLVGVYQDVRSNANSVAILREKQSGKRFKVRTGDQIGRLRVAQIRPKDVVFTIEDFGFERQETLSLRKQEDVTP